MEKIKFMFGSFFIAYFKEKGKKGVFACMLLYFFSIFASKIFCYLRSNTSISILFLKYLYKLD